LSLRGHDAIIAKSVDKCKEPSCAYLFKIRIQDIMEIISLSYKE